MGASLLQISRKIERSSYMSWQFCLVPLAFALDDRSIWRVVESDGRTLTSPSAAVCAVLVSQLVIFSLVRVHIFSLVPCRYVEEAHQDGKTASDNPTSPSGLGVTENGEAAQSDERQAADEAAGTGLHRGDRDKSDEDNADANDDNSDEGDHDENGEDGEEKESKQDGAVAPLMDARAAFRAGDEEASRQYHQAKMQGEVEGGEAHAGPWAAFVKSIVFGGLDGTITTFAIVASIVGANLEIEVVILLGFSNLIADAISMGMGDYLSTTAEMEYVMQERSREAWEWRVTPEGEIQEMIDLYMKKGFDREDAETIIHTYTKKEKYHSLFIDHMMVEELGHIVPDEDEDPRKDGLVTFFSFIIFGSVPLWLYVIFFGAGYDDRGGSFAIACVATAMTLFGLGCFKAQFTKQTWWKSGGLMMANGSLAAIAAFLISFGLESAIGVNVD